MIRLFAAIALPDDIAGSLGERQTGLAGARWRPRESLHITLRFFGNIPETVAADLDAALETVRAPALSLIVQGVGCFGEGPSIHAVWAGIADNPDLNRLAGACERSARRCGLKSDVRRYRPHITLAYLNRPEPASVAAWIQRYNLLRAPAFPVRAFGLYSSWMGREGSFYRFERAYALSINSPGESLPRS